MTAEPAYMVLGGAGRLGRCLIPRIRARCCTVIGVSRNQPGGSAERHEGWVRADLTDTSRWPKVQDAVRQLLGDQHDVVIADLLLDRTSVTSMRTSITAATGFVLRTQEVLAAEGFAVRVLAASTTAALAPCGLRTPYGLAKRDQAVRYSRLGRVAIVLLPQLADAERPAMPPHGSSLADGGSCSYDAAAEALHAVSLQSVGRSLWVVRSGIPYRPPSPRGVTGLPRAVGSLVIARTAGRDSPAAHRRASRERMALLPTRIRTRVDHHGAPDQLLRPFERLLHMPHARTLTANSPPAPDQPEEDHAYRP